MRTRATIEANCCDGQGEMLRIMSRRCSREGSLIGCWRRIARTVCGLAFVLVALLAMGAPGDFEAVAESRRGSGEASRAVGDVRCPDCDDKGRMKCSQCGGKGLLARDCPRCDATGRRPCRVCTDGESADSPGRLVCPGCAGSGTVGDEGRTCPRCGGRQTVICGTCLGKGSHSCRKHILDKVCPTCRFSGRTPCTTCDGKLWLAPAVLASRKAKPASRKTSPPSDADSTAATKRPRRRASQEDAEEDKAPKVFDVDALRTRVARVTPTYEGHYDLFADDLRFEISTLGDKVKSLERRLRDAGAARPLRTELDAWQKRARDFHKRWGELRELFSKEHQAHLSARRVWEARDEGVKGLKGYRLELFNKQYNSRLRITTEIAEKASTRLAHFQPETLLDESRQLTILWKEYEKRGESELSLAVKKAAEEAERVAEAKKAAKAKKEEEKRKAERAAARKRAQQRGDKARSSARSTRTDRSRAAASRLSRPDNERRKEKVFRRAKKKSSEPEPEGGGVLGTVFAVVVGFGAASCLFFLKTFRQRRSEE